MHEFFSVMQFKLVALKFKRFDVVFFRQHKPEHSFVLFPAKKCEYISYILPLKNIMHWNCQSHEVAVLLHIYVKSVVILLLPEIKSQLTYKLDLQLHCKLIYMLLVYMSFRLTWSDVMSSIAINLTCCIG